MFYVKEEVINGRTVRYLITEDNNGNELILGYIDNFNKVHFYTSKK